MSGEAAMLVRRIIALSLAVLLFALRAPASRADDILDVQAGALYDSNLSRAQYAYDVKSDTALQAALSWGRLLPLADGLTLRATVDAQGEFYSRYAGLDNLALGGALTLRRKFGLGALAPWASVSGSAARLEYENSIRNGWRYEIGGGAGKRLTNAWNVATSFAYQHRTADDRDSYVPGFSGAVFDLHSRRGGLLSEYTLSERLSVSAGYDQRRGDVASTTLRNFTIFTHSDAIAPDPVFGADAVGYRIHAITHAWRLGASCAVGPANAINLTAERWISRARGGLDYYNTLLGLSYAHAL
jgi:hypothetical protein